MAQQMDFDVKKLSNAEKLIFYSAIAAAISIFLPWKDLGEFGSMLGISDAAWIPLILGWGPAMYIILKPNKLNPVVAAAGSVIALVWGLIYLAAANIENPFTGETHYVGSFGIIVFCIAAAVLFFGLIKKYKNIAGLIAAFKAETSEAADDTAATVETSEAADDTAATVETSKAADDTGMNNSQNDCATFAQTKYMVSGSKIICNKTTVATITVSKENGNIIYDIIDTKSNANIFRFVRTDKNMTGINPANNQTCFAWQRLSSGIGELFTGSKWQCGNLNLSQSALRSMMMWIPRISWFIPTKYTVIENGKSCGLITGAVFSFTNARNVSTNDNTRSWEIMAAALVLCDDEIG